MRRGRRVDMADGELHYGTRMLPVVCESCEHLCGTMTGQSYCWWLGDDHTVDRTAACEAVTSSGRARFNLRGERP